MDPEVTMCELRNTLIKISDVVSMRLVNGGSSLDKHDANAVVDLLIEAMPYARDYAEWLNKGGYRPGLRHA